MTENIATIGHNNPPSDQELMAERNAEVLKRVDELVAALARAPEKIEDDEQAGKVTGYIAQMTKAEKELEAVRVKEKAPFLEMGRKVDGFFSPMSDNLGKAKRKMNTILTDYQREQARLVREAERVRAENERIEAARLEAEALALAEANKPKQADEVLNQAATAERTAVRAEEASTAKASTLTKARSGEGASATLRTVWKGELIDRATLDLEALRQHIPADAFQTAINSFIRAGGRELHGARIWEHTESVVR